MWKRRTRTSDLLKYLQKYQFLNLYCIRASIKRGRSLEMLGMAFPFSHRLSNLPAQVRRGRRATRLARAPLPHATKHLVPESFPHFRPLFKDELKVGETLKLFPFHPSVAVLIRGIHKREQNHPSKAELKSLWLNQTIFSLGKGLQNWSHPLCEGCNQ